VAANIVTTDTLLTLWEAAAVLAFTAWWERREGPWCRLPLLAMWAAFGVAFLTKGPPGMLPLLGIAAFVVLAAGWRELGHMFCLPGLLTFAVVGLGWYAVVALIEPGLMTYFLRDEVARRVGTGVHNRYSEWYGPLRVYLPVLFAGTLPWTHLLVARVTALPRTMLARRWWREAAVRDPWAVLLASWVLLPLLVFSLSRSRLELYILPLFVPIAVVVARLMAERPVTRRMRAFALAWALGMVALRWVGSVHESDRDSRAMARELLALVTPAPREVVFYETKPVWGLSLYLDCQVERIRSTADPSAPPDGTSTEALFTELVEHEPRRLVVAPYSRRGEVAAAMERARLPYREIATLGGRVLVADGADLQPVQHATR
jgi:4-amino-4-deoxy-L-arabinose transferase-like glycosyltransferase